MYRIPREGHRKHSLHRQRSSEAPSGTKVLVLPLGAHPTQAHAGRRNPGISQLSAVIAFLLLSLSRTLPCPTPPFPKTKGKWGTGFSRHQQPSPEPPETPGSATSLSSPPRAAPSSLGACHQPTWRLESPNSNFHSREQLRYSIPNIWASTGVLPPLRFTIITTHL